MNTKNQQVMIEILANLAALNQNLKEFRKIINNGFNTANDLIGSEGIIPANQSTK
jgi:hypothetical protein